MPETTREDTRTKRRAILDAAAELFARQGYENTTIADIARAAGMAVGTVYLYFHNKHEIYSSVSIDWVEAIARVLQDPAILALPIRQVPRAVIEASFRICHDNQVLMPLFQVDVQSAEEIWQHKLAEGSITKALDAFLRQAIEQGQLAPFDTEMYAKILFGMVHSMLYECYCIEHGENEKLYRERTIEVVERLFFGPSLIVESE
ncbi:MAG TPA: TetR/AcrR family transcriptional regulator [Ktedonobacteraceae bacterium]|nr:TetR/AcrR family transcriptional regulator [Ktedonobacteraceae bacterium]